MKTHSPSGLLSVVLPLVFALCSAARDVASGFDEPEDSPLFAASVQQVLDDWGTRDVVTPGAGDRQAGVARGKSAVIAVEGTRWSWLPVEAGPAGRAGRSGRKSPFPMTYTLGTSTCSYPTCAGGGTCSGTTCSSSATCVGSYTCGDQQSTCVWLGGWTCSGGPTCVGSATCQGTTCNQGTTCVPWVTCVSSDTCSSTCGPYPTCHQTCTAAQCPTTLEGVMIPEPGQIQMWFNSLSQVQYTLQYCTNLDAGQWMVGLTTNGNGGMITVSHTNNADRSFYRLVIQSQ